MESLGIPIWIGRNRNQPVFASWYDDIDWFLKKGKELKAPHHANAAALCDDYITAHNIIPNTSNSSFMVAIYIQILFD